MPTDTLVTIGIVLLGIVAFFFVLKILGKTVKIAITVLIIAIIAAAAYFLLF